MIDYILVKESNCAVIYIYNVFLFQFLKSHKNVISK